MKIIHCADIHLDSPMESKLNKEQAKKRKIELLHNFAEMIEYAKNEKIDAIIIAGDLFDDTRKSMLKSTKKYVIDLIKENQEIDFLYIKGNHDLNNFLDGEEIPENLKLFSEEWSQYRYQDIVISGVELNKNDTSIFDKLLLNFEDYNIVVLHGQIDKSINPKDKSEIITLNKLKNKNIDYLALGHIHKREEGILDLRGKYCYPGCLEGRSFDECGEKGFYILEIENKKLIDMKFIQHSKRTIHNVEINITNLTSQINIENEIIEKTSKIPSKDMVRVTLVGNYEISEDKDDYINTEIIEEKMEERFFYFEIKNNTKVIINYQEFAGDISLKGEFVRSVEEEDLTEEEKSQVCLMGIRAILGGEI